MTTKAQIFIGESLLLPHISHWFPCVAYEGQKEAPDPDIRVCEYAKVGDIIPRTATGKFIAKNVKILRYGVGGHFQLHVDSKVGDSHYGTLLVFSPSGGEFDGGELEIGNPLLEKVETFSPAKITEWNYVIIPLGIKHRVLPVTRGTRYVIKAELHYSIPDVPEPSDSDFVEYYSDKITQIDEEITELQKKKDALSGKTGKYSTNEYLVHYKGRGDYIPPQLFGDLPEEIRVVLGKIMKTNEYPKYVMLSRDPDGTLAAADKILFNQLKKIYKNVEIAPCEIVWEFEETTRPPEDFQHAIKYCETKKVRTNDKECEFILWPGRKFSGGKYDGGYNDQAWEPYWISGTMLTIKISD